MFGSSYASIAEAKGGFIRLALAIPTIPTRSTKALAPVCEGTGGEIIEVDLIDEGDFQAAFGP